MVDRPIISAREFAIDCSTCLGDGCGTLVDFCANVRLMQQLFGALLGPVWAIPRSNIRPGTVAVLDVFED